MKRMILMFLASCLLTNCACVARGAWASQDKSEKGKVPGNQPAVASVQSPQPNAEYKIGAQDVLQIDVWKEPEITRSVPVRPDGKITLPLLNDVQAAGQTPMELAGAIREELKKYINDPQVSVSVSTINSRRVYVTGEVTRPGAFPLLPGMTVLQALTSGGGFTPFAKIKSIYVLRTEGSRQVKLPFNYKAVVGGKKPEDNILLQSGDTIVVP
jgi:polysaccharide export outer membrane protein